MESCRYRGVCLLALLGLFGSLAVGPAVAQFPAEKVAMYSHVTLRDMGASSALDCWGYVSESGREYAIVGLNTGTSFVEITDPSNPVVVGMIPRGGKDMKVYKHYVYSSTDGGPFLIIDVGDIDNGNIKLKVLKKKHNQLECEVLTEGVLGSRRHIIFPGSASTSPP